MVIKATFEIDEDEIRKVTGITENSRRKTTAPVMTLFHFCLFFLFFIFLNISFSPFGVIALEYIILVLQ